MTLTLPSVQHLSDRDLLAHVQRAAAGERRATAELIALLSEVDSRRTYLGEGCSSLFTYCTQVLHLSEHAAYGRIEAARASRRFPILLEELADGRLTWTAVALLSPHLTTENVSDVLEAARYKSKREVEQLVARLHPRPDAPALVRKLPELKPTVPSVTDTPVAQRLEAAPLHTATAAPVRAARPATLEPLSPERYKIQFTVSRETYIKLRAAQDLLRHTIPDGDLASIFDKALTMLVDELSRKKLAATERPRNASTAAHRSRHVPAAVRRAVWTRDGGRCRFVGTGGRGQETGFLEFHHVVPYAMGGKTTAENLELRCRAHNAYEMEQYFRSIAADGRASGRVSRTSARTEWITGRRSARARDGDHAGNSRRSRRRGHALGDHRTRDGVVARCIVVIEPRGPPLRWSRRTAGRSGNGQVKIRRAESPLGEAARRRRVHRRRDLRKPGSDEPPTTLAENHDCDSPTDQVLLIADVSIGRHEQLESGRFWRVEEFAVP